MVFVYVLFSKEFNKFYVGLTTNLTERLRTHNAGKVTSTKAYKPWMMIYNESYPTLEAARNREKYLKSAAGRRWRQNNLGSHLNDL